MTIYKEIDFIFMSLIFFLKKVGTVFCFNMHKSLMSLFLKYLTQ